MTSPVAVIGLTYDGYDLQRADLDVFFQITEGLDTLPDTRGDDQLIPFRTGRLPQPRMGDRRPIVAMGWVTRPSVSQTSAYRVYLDGLKAKLEPTGSPRVLVATLEDGSKRWTSAVPRNLLPGDGWGSDFRSFSIEWEALDPYWYGTYGTLALDGGLFLDAGWSLDSSTAIVVTGTADFDTLGTAAVERVVVRFTGPSSGSVGIEVGGSDPVGFMVARTLAAGEVLEVDNDARTALLGGASVRNLMSLYASNQHGEYIRLPAGPVTLNAIGGAAETRVLFSPTYL
jgi:hypothetical protein